MGQHVLLLLRHAKAESYVPGAHDDQRPLSETGRRQAVEVGELLCDTTVDHVLCSPSTRTRETLDGLGLQCPVDYRDEIYNAGSDTILAALTGVPEHVGTVLVVGHAPGVPALALDLADAATSDAEALAQLETGYPPATITRLELDGTWADLASARARLTMARVRR